MRFSQSASARGRLGSDRVNNFIMLACGIGHERVETTSLVDEEIGHVEIAVLPLIDKGRTGHVMDQLMESSIELAIFARAAGIAEISPELTIAR